MTRTCPNSGCNVPPWNSNNPRDIYNVKQVERDRILAGRSPLVVLLDGLEELSDASYFAKFDAQRELAHPLITSPSAK